jgi:hypothetical protein
MSWNYGNFAIDLELKDKDKHVDFEILMWGESVRKLTESNEGLEIAIGFHKGKFCQSKVFFFKWDEIESLTFTKKGVR